MIPSFCTVYHYVSSYMLVKIIIIVVYAATEVLGIACIIHEHGNMHVAMHTHNNVVISDEFKSSYHNPEHAALYLASYIIYDYGMV